MRYDLIENDIELYAAIRNVDWYIILYQFWLELNYCFLHWLLLGMELVSKNFNCWVVTWNLGNIIINLRL